MEKGDEAWLALAGELEDRVDQLAGVAVSSAATRLPEWMREPPVDAQLFAYVRGSLLAQIGALQAGRLPTELPDADRAGVQDAARGGTPVSLLLAGYRAAHQALWRCWSRLADGTAASARSAADLREAGSDFLFAYADRISELVADEYAAERGRTLRSAEKSRVDAVCSVLDGDDAGAKRLDHPVSGYNVALLGAGRDPAKWLPQLARELGSRLLVLDVLPDPWWAWLGRSRPFDSPLGPALAASSAGEWRLGVGTELEGPAGFRETHRQAAAAFRAAQLPQRPIVHYPEVAAEDLASADPERAQTFIDCELAPLTHVDHRSVQLLQTLSTYLASDGNRRSTAAKLGIHHQTVAQRLAAVEERLGVELEGRRLELELALRLREYMARDSPAS